MIKSMVSLIALFSIQTAHANSFICSGKVLKNTDGDVLHKYEYAESCSDAVERARDQLICVDDKLMNAMGVVLADYGYADICGAVLAKSRNKMFCDGSVVKNYKGYEIFDFESDDGFKCFVHNKGTRNDEGGVALHDSYYCFHMGTGGPARFSTRFHSMDFHVVTATGVRMDVQGLADVGNVGTICTDPREQRTVMGYGCKLDSAYEIWENRLNIVNKGNTVASATTSTAVFDPITVMDPADKTKLVYTWDPTAMANIFKFNDDRSGARGCDREAYSGPLNWYNSTGVQTYYTDVYGNVVDGGALKQTISNVNTKSAGSLTQYGGLIMAYKGGTEPMVQFKYRKSACVPGLGLKN
jgi:hypothetical protein